MNDDTLQSPCKGETLQEWRVSIEEMDATAQQNAFGKLTHNPDGPFIIKEQVRSSVYQLQSYLGEDILRTWNARDLKKFYL